MVCRSLRHTDLCTFYDRRTTVVGGVVVVVVVVVKIRAHFPHGCGTHFTLHTYLCTLAQGVKRLHQDESKLHELDFKVECC